MASQMSILVCRLRPRVGGAVSNASSWIWKTLSRVCRTSPLSISAAHLSQTCPAKPLLDIDVICAKEQVQEAIDALCSNSGYVSKGEWGISGRWALRNPSLLPLRNLYVCEDGCQGLRNHLAVRDTLRNNAKLRDEYGRVKREIAARGLDLDAYCEAKNDILDRILKEGWIRRRRPPWNQRGQI